MNSMSHEVAGTKVGKHNTCRPASGCPLMAGLISELLKLQRSMCPFRGSHNGIQARFAVDFELAANGLSE